MNFKLVGALVGAGILAGGVGLYLSGESDKGEIVGSPAIEAADPVFSTDIGYPVGNKVVHVVGVRVEKGDAITETAIGTTVVKNAPLPDDALCTIVLDAPAIIKTLGDVRGVTKKEVPNLPLCDKHFGIAMDPIKILGSELNKSWIWYGMLQGKGCEEIVTCAGSAYLGSSMKEFVALPDSTKKRFLLTQGRCIGKEDISVACTVPVGDIKAIAGAKIFFPMELADRVDLNFPAVENGIVQARYPTKEVAEPIEEVVGEVIP